MIRGSLVVLLVCLLGAACTPDTQSVALSAEGRLYEGHGYVLENRAHGPELCIGEILDSLPPGCGGIPIVGWDWAQVRGEESVNGTTWGQYVVRGRYDGDTLTLVSVRTMRAGEFTPPDVDFSPACDAPDTVDASHGADHVQEAPSSWIPLAANELVAEWLSQPTADSPFTYNLIVVPGVADRARDRIRTRYLGPLCLVEADAPTQEQLEATRQEAASILGDQASFSSTNARRHIVEMGVVTLEDERSVRVLERFGERVVLLPALELVEDE